MDSTLISFQSCNHAKKTEEPKQFQS